MEDFNEEGTFLEIVSTGKRRSSNGQTIKPNTVAAVRPARTPLDPRRINGAGQRPANTVSFQHPPKKRTSAPPKRKSGVMPIVLLLALFFIAVLVIAHAVKGGTSENKAAVPAVPADPEVSGETSGAEDPDSETPDRPSADGGVLAPYADSSTVRTDPAIECSYVIMVERGTGHIVTERASDTRIYPASLTKIMTLIVAVENCGSLDDTLTYTFDLINPYYRQNASMAGFSVGETVTLRDMLYGMILPSGADAAAGITQLIAGGEDKFVELMNEKAAELGLKNTHFANAAGLHDEKQYTTCREMAIILDHAIRNPDCREILSAYKYTTSQTEEHPDGIELTSDLQSRMEGGESGVARIYGGKTGYVTEAKHCLACFAAANSDGREYVMVTCGGSSKWKPIFDCINLCKKYIGGLDIE